ncbi:NeuD/PglB/VioB family sugar acetyltransferase [Streptomyces yangpuensis]|uniref:NeuD/PglB/VioB family sugar acetyltransferase n=1 Tax=Streptomyces sp. gCLA4 TaxID=1873416 RepID=UPI001603D335|nr:NeuD/PglB/VioB family sugar acetyltransferase [Streptomyces sp. gCLA4]
MSAPVTEDLLIVGAGGFARETAQAVRDVAAADVAGGRPPRWRLAGHLDDDPALHGREVDGVPVRGGCELVHERPAARVVVCVGSPRDYAVRARLVRRLGLPPERYATVVHPTAAVSGSSSVGPGSVLLAHSVLTAGVRVGAHVAVMPQVVLTHEDEVADFATLASGVRLGGGVRVGRGAYVGAGALVREYTAIGAWSLTGMGSTVLVDVPAGEVWAGGPARRLRPAGAAALAELARETGGRGGAGYGPALGAPVPAGAPAHGTEDGSGTEDGTGPDGRRPETRMGSPVA